MQNYTQQELKERFEKLPEVLKDAMFNTDIAAKIFEIGKKHGLTIEKTGFMAEEVGYLILGLTHPTELVNVLAEALEVKENQAKEIASDLNQQVFYPLREALKETHQIEIGESALQKNVITLKKPEPAILSLPGQKLATSPFLTPKPPSAPLSSVVTTPATKTPAPSMPPPPPPKPAVQQTPTPPAQLPPEPKPKEMPLLPPPPTASPVAPPTPLPIPQPPKPAPGSKPVPILLAPLPGKVDIDLRSQQKIKLPDLPPPKPESMGGSVFGAPKIVNLTPKPPTPPQPPAEKNPTLKPQRDNDPYREPME